MLRDSDHRKKAEFLSREACIGYIIEHQFELDADIDAQQFGISDDALKYGETEDFSPNSLNSLDDARILEIYRNIKDKEAARRFESYAEREPYLFFNQPSADADLSYWLDLEVWTAEQAAALSMGKEPSVVNEQSMTGPLRSSKVRFAYRNRSDAILSALQAGKLQTPIEPRAFISWALQKRWTIPIELQEWVNQATYEELSRKVYLLEAEVKRLSDMQKAAMAQSIDELDPRLQRTLHKMILGMAIARYSHRIGMNSQGPAHIVDDLEQLADDKLSLKVDAVRGVLKNAADYLDVSTSGVNAPKWIRIRR